MAPPRASLCLVHPSTVAANDHDGDHEPRAEQPPERAPARPLSPRMAARRRVALVLDGELRAAGVTNGQLERWLGIDEKTIRLQRAGDRAFALEDLAELPPTLGERVALAVVHRKRAA